MKYLSKEDEQHVAEDFQGPPGASLRFAEARGSARTCEWETVAPAKICGEPAVCVTKSGKHLCKRHGQQIENRWPGYIDLIEAPNK